jgi:FkbM family methyltransferase
MLSLPVKAAASIMRHLPLQVRRARMLRESIYGAVGAAGWQENAEVDALWTMRPQVTRGRLSGMKMELDLTDWLQRRAYFTGRFYQEDIEDLLTLLLLKGDNFVDIGANIGLVTLHAASIVGSSVWAFEPVPDTYARLARHLEMNGLDCRAFNMGLGSEPATLRMNLLGRHSGKATLVDHGDEAIASVAVEIERGDAVLKLDGPTLFKIDVEGFEAQAVEGLGAILDGDVAVVIEVSAPWLEKAGSSASALHDLLQSHGLKPYSFGHREGRMSRDLVIEPLSGPLDSEQYDCLFMSDHSAFAQRVAVA